MVNIPNSQRHENESNNKVTKKIFACLIDKKMMTFAQYPQESGDWPSPLLVRQ